MKLRGIDFGNVLGASGVQGFFGEGYWFHHLWGPWAPDLAGMTFVAKTATIHPRLGNMPLTLDHTPRDLFPGCVKAKPWRGIMLNAVGLSNPGLIALLGDGRWQHTTRPFMISVMSTADTPRYRLEDLRRIVDMLAAHRYQFKAPFGLQVNLSCPNAGHDPHELIGETAQVLDVAGTLGIPLMPKFSIASAPIEAVRELESHPACDAICVSNTVPYDWEGIGRRAWGRRISPLQHLNANGGGLSGAVLRPLVCDWIARLRDAGFTKPINGGGGILVPNDVNKYHSAGASSVFLGSVVPFASFAPFLWNVRALIGRANALHWR